MSNGAGIGISMFVIVLWFLVTVLLLWLCRSVKGWMKEGEEKDCGSVHLAI